MYFFVLLILHHVGDRPGQFSAQTLSLYRALLL